MESNDNHDKDEVLSLNEKERIENLIQNEEKQKQKQKQKKNNISNLFNLFNLVNSKQEAEYNFGRITGLNPKIYVNNISGKRAWIILTPAPIKNISSLGVGKFGFSVGFETEGEYKCQESIISNNSRREFELDNNQIYYTVIFDCDGKWKITFKNRKINARKYDINLLERHVEEAVDFSSLPANL